MHFAAASMGARKMFPLFCVFSALYGWKEPADFPLFFLKWNILFLQKFLHSSVHSCSRVLSRVKRLTEVPVTQERRFILITDIQIQAVLPLMRQNLSVCPLERPPGPFRKAAEQCESFPADVPLISEKQKGRSASQAENPSIPCSSLSSAE